MKFFTPGITLGRNMMVDVRIAKYSPREYYRVLAHERAHIYQQAMMGRSRFYTQTLYEYLINPGYSTELSKNPISLEYWADEYMKLTPSL